MMNRKPMAAWWLVVWAACGAASGAGEPAEESWYAVMLAGQHVGHLRQSETRDGDQIVSEEMMRVALRRGEVAVEVEYATRFVETAEGQPVEASVRMQLAQQPTTTTFTFIDAGVEVVTEASGRTTHSTAATPEGPWLTPAAARRQRRELAGGGATEIRQAILDISGGLPDVAETTMTRVGATKVEVMGKTVPAEAWDTRAAAAPNVVLHEFHDERGNLLRSTMSMGFMELEILAAERAIALSPVDPPEMVAQTFIRPEGELTNPRRLRRAVYRLTLPESFGADLPRAGFQRVTWGDDRTAMVVLDLDEPVNPIGDEATGVHLAASMMLDHEHESVRALVAQALGEGAAMLGAAEKAERLRRFVHEYVASKNLSVGFATAAEVARTGEGDCSEHAVLLAAMLRAAEIPSRTVTGLIYVEQFLEAERIFGYHMWTQAWLDDSGHQAASREDAMGSGDSGGSGSSGGAKPQACYGGSEGSGGSGGSGGGGSGGLRGGRWVDLDGTLAESFDAAHVALAVSGLEDGSLLSEMIELLPLFSRLQIEVIESQ